MRLRHVRDVVKIVSADFKTAAVNEQGWPRDGLPQVAFVGRSNVGKSSLINKVFHKRGLMRVSNTPGRTQAVIFARLGEKGWVVDLPGFGYAKVPLSVKASWAKLVEYYLARPSCAGASARRPPICWGP